MKIKSQVRAISNQAAKDSFDRTSNQQPRALPDSTIGES